MSPRAPGHPNSCAVVTACGLTVLVLTVLVARRWTRVRRGVGSP